MCFSCEEFVQVLAVFLSLLFCLLCVCVCGLHCRRSWICLGYQSFVRWVFYKYFLRVCFLFIFLTVSLDEQKCVSLIKSHLSVFSFIVIAYCELRQFCLTPEVMKVISFVSSKTFCFFANLYLGLWYISKKVFRFFFLYDFVSILLRWVSFPHWIALVKHHLAAEVGSISETFILLHWSACHCIIATLFQLFVTL